MFAVVIVGLFLMFLIWRWYRDTPERPALPGPPGKPIIGNLKDLDASAPHMKMTELAEKYGPVYVLRIFSTNMIVVSGYEELREVFLNKGAHFAGRPERQFRSRYFIFGKEDMTFADPTVPFWSPVRRTMIHNLKMYGEGMERLEGVLTSATKEAMDKLRERQGEPLDINQDLYNYTMKMIVYFTTGMSLTDDAPALLKLKEMEHLLLTNIGMTGKGPLLDKFPFLRFFGNQTYKNIKRARELLVDLWEGFKTEHEANPDNALYKASCMYAIRDQQKSLKDEAGKAVLDDLNSMAIICNLWIAGIVTTSNNLYAMINILCQNQHVAKQIQHEVDSVVGRDRQVSLNDREHLHYTRAAIFESLRYCSLVSLGLPHCTTRQTDLMGASIPKGTMVMTNIWAIHHDSEFWDEPWTYRPERFLDEEGHLLPPDHEVRKRLMTFGAGPRMCIGSVLALNRMLVFIASLMQSFTLEADPDNIASFDPRSYDLAMTLRPKPYKVKFIQR